MKRKIVLVDDDAIYRLIAARLLGLVDTTLQIDQFENGQLALDYLQKEMNVNGTYTILLDINMPVLDGWGFLDKVEKKKVNEFPNLHIYIVSSSTDKSDLSKAGQYKSVKGFFHKPLSMENIKAIVSERYLT
ncbi:response regulator [Nonlabens marinus]|uniref:Two-component response regulator n=1 Tax=Nonlabens marinus S1-08 TaxID=1454201 RepID=W8VXN2_9FLAO|nr:response regulator [Nonlabens marinus]BAO56222.1 two-component response regulator [Nonlabens marinus S1-08]